MTDRQHVLEVYEPYEYEGQNPLMLEGVAVLPGPMRDKYYLLRLDKPFVFEQNKVELLLVSPRYNGDKIDRTVSSACTVNIARVPPDTDLQNKSSITFEDFVRWGVGKISLYHPHS
ncbi:MAG: hypothetical protein U9P00_08255 [Pseudomonadota bacterium]|nr:hypothetical protein [Pseudomonadota bacterium]